jgi:hypothetical protein
LDEVTGRGTQLDIQICNNTWGFIADEDEPSNIPGDVRTGVAGNTVSTVCELPGGIAIPTEAALWKDW